VNGTGTHFWLSEGVMTPLLTSGDVVLSGKTFSRQDTGHQWFDELMVSNKGVTVLDVTTADGKTRVEFDGKVVSAGKVSTAPCACQLSPSILLPALTACFSSVARRRSAQMAWRSTSITQRA
jgi:hypothetical protein